MLNLYRKIAKTWLKKLSIGLFTLIPFCSFASQPTKKEHMLADIDFIKNTFEVSYAPAEWKQKHSGWNLEIEIQKAKEAILALGQPQAKDFQRIIKKFFQSTRDHHVGVMFYSTESATLPFRVKGANGKYFFSYIDRNRLSPLVFPFTEGDELVYFDGKPTDEVVQELRCQEIGNGNENTERALAEIYLTTRIGALGHDVPKGPVMITVKPVNSENYSSFQLIWDYDPERISSALTTRTSQPTSAIFNDPFFQKKLLPPFYEKILNIRAEETEGNDLLGSNKSFIPPLGRVWWETDPSSAFHAYLFEADNHKLIGYIRIPNYLGGESHVREFAEIIQFFQERSDALVIDQINNPGGFLFYLYALASMLSDQPLNTPKHRIKITPEDVYFATWCTTIFEEVHSDEDAHHVLGENFQGIPVTYQMAQFFLNFCRFIIEEWETGHTYTSPFYLYGIDRINPDPYTHYTKPILLLINSLDFSGGDFFPAIMQDNKRVTLMGTRTAGAGGYLGLTSFPNLYGIAFFHYTASIAERADNCPIENIGVTPDIVYEITQEDLQFGYNNYADAIRNAVNHFFQEN